MMNKEKMLLDKIQQYDFAVQEASLFLNSHPDDHCAMDYYRYFKELLKEAKHEYDKDFGPLTSRSNHADQWKYVYGPWPWEGGK